MKVIAKQGNKRYLIYHGDDIASIADMEFEERYPPENILKTIKHGYWEDFDHDEKLLKELLKLPEAG